MTIDNTWSGVGVQNEQYECMTHPAHAARYKH